MTENIDYSDPSREIPDFYADVVRDEAEGFTGLDTLESSEHVPTSNGYRDFLISGMRSAIDKADRLYTRLDEINKKHNVFNFRTCHTQAAFLRHIETGKLRIGSNSCKLRFCPLCQRTKKAIITANVKDWLKDKKKPKFITLTLEHSDNPLSDQIDRLYDSFREVRRTVLWRSKIKGGVWFFQIKKSKTDNRWHPHLHICCHGDYIDKFQLSTLWERITNGSKIVDVRKVDKTAKAAEYVGRYAATACEVNLLDDLDFVELACSLSGRRIAGTFGSAKGLQLSIRPPIDKEDWQELRRFSDVYESKDYDPESAQIWASFISGQFCPILPNIAEPPNKAVDLEYQIKKATEQLLLFGQK